ncbi:hypothetical protein ACIP9H_40295 [Streptomyces sp. NPDC088732]|uniref:hypothetical protein n=1 Tax=Streptomyces sp. NPDC088732 TaxID=3365879 RepID=UPI00380EDB72
MTTYPDTALAAPRGAASQATQIEQSRAVAEVQAAILMAKQCPRSVQQAIADMQQACRIKSLADRAFYSYTRGGSKVTGATIHLARALAAIYGNLQYGVSELSRDVAAGQSEVLAYAWDLQANTRVANIFIVPHLRDARGEKNPLPELRDVYENNANQGARRVREAILSVLPGWFVDDAKELCTATIRDGGGVPLPQRIAKALKTYEDLGVTAERIERQIGRVSDKWTAHDLADLTITLRSIQRNETTVEDEFPSQVTSAEILTPTTTPVAAVTPAPDDAEQPAAPAAVWPETAKPGSGARR